MTQTLYLEKMINANIREYGNSYNVLRFLDADEIASSIQERDSLLAWLSGNASISCAGTKIECYGLSPGCLKCADGGWSCLFVNGRCNGRCFYCPTAQDDDGPPVTNGIVFTEPADYAAYLERFGFSGASISGGEPLLVPELTLSFIRAVRERCGNRIHLWMYTNGTMLTSELCRRLRDAGLDEIRFDIGAVRYNLKKLRLAVGVIPVVTVEIPAVPEDEALMKLKMLEMKESGVQYLNLHQLRLTPHNLPYFLERGYGFIHGEKITVPSSELCALRLVKHSVESGTGLAVNYCSFPYKRRFQHAAARRRAAFPICSSEESVTESGYLRTICDNTVSYSEAVIIQQPSYRCAFEKIVLETGRSLYLERRPVAPGIQMSAEQIIALKSADCPPQLLAFERIEQGLSTYF